MKYPNLTFFLLLKKSFQLRINFTYKLIYYVILSLEPWRNEVLEEALKHDIIFADDINLDINSMQFPKRTNNLMFSCFTCSKVFQSQAECKMHISAVHEGRKLNYQCPICSYLFANQRALKEHAERFHKEKKIENFDRPRKLNNQCAICSYQFLNHSALNEHVARFHKSENIENQTSLITSNYGNTGCRVFKRGYKNWKDFCLKINIPKENY